MTAQTQKEQTKNKQMRISLRLHRTGVVTSLSIRTSIVVAHYLIHNLSRNQSVTHHLRDFCVKRVLPHYTSRDARGLSGWVTDLMMADLFQEEDRKEYLALLEQTNQEVAI